MTTLNLQQKTTFLDQVMERSGLPDIYDARDFSVVVFRTLRDLLTTEAADSVASNLETASISDNRDKSLQGTIADLWNDTNPVVGTLSRLRGPLKVDDDRFLRRIIEEGGGLPSGITPKQALKAVFSATKQHLMLSSIQTIESVLPPKVLAIWQES